MNNLENPTDQKPIDSRMKLNPSQNIEERLKEIFGDGISSFEEKYHRNKEYLKKTVSKHKGGFKHAMF